MKNGANQTYKYLEGKDALLGRIKMLTSEEALELENRIDREHEEFQKVIHGSLAKIDERFKEFDKTHTENLKHLADEFDKAEARFEAETKKTEERFGTIEKRVKRFETELHDRHTKAGLAAKVPEEKMKAFGTLYEQLGKKLEGMESKGTAQAMLYGAVDEAVKLMDLKGDLKTVVHVEKSKLIWSGLGVAVASAGAAVGVMHVVQNRSLKKAGRTRTEYREWLKGSSKPTELPPRTQSWAAAAE